jgi:hypothetical protein
MTSGNALARVLNGAPGTIKPLLTSPSFTETGFTGCGSVTGIPQSECNALVALYNNAGGSSWTHHTNWIQTNTPCLWYGVNCLYGHVRELVLPTNNLHGNIPYQLGDLTQLRYLSLYGNSLSGGIPTQLGNLSLLTNLILYSNPLSGSLPVSLENLKNLKSFYFFSTSLCEPSDVNFQAWLHGIKSLDGTDICLIISGNAGDIGVTLHYTSGTAQTITSASNGHYSFAVLYGWSGTVTPTKTGATFKPASRTYTGLTSDQINQNYAVIVNFISAGANDGWILESAKGIGKGGTMNSTNTTFLLGDDSLNRQYRAILSFNTAGLPDTAVIQSAVIKIKPSGLLLKNNPFSVLGSLYADIRTGYFGKSPALELVDFSALSTANKIGSFSSTPVSGWYSATINATGISDINKINLTQLRLYFALPTNNNNAANNMPFFSGDAAAGSQPLLIITYSLP